MLLPFKDMILFSLSFPPVWIFAFRRSRRKRACFCAGVSFSDIPDETGDESAIRNEPQDSLRR